MYVSLQFLFFVSISIIVIVNGNNSTLFTEDTLRNSHGNIIFSSVIFRHGERSPIQQYPTDPYKNESYWQAYWPQGKGQLTKRGKLQEYNLGKWFRKRYDSLVKAGYRYDLLTMHSSDIDRTIMSAECFLAGFFPPSANETFADDGLKWQPVPVRTIPHELDAIINFGVTCERYKSEKDIVNRSPGLRDFYFIHQDVFDYIAEKSGLEFSSNNVLQAFDDIYYLYDALLNEELKNLTLPAWTNTVYPKPLSIFAALSLSNTAYSHEMRRIVAGTLIGKLIEEMELKTQDELDARFDFYSGHDNTIAALLTSLEIFDGILPPYSASVLFELRRKHNDYVVTILYRNTTTLAPYLLQLPGCEYVCTLENFKKLTENLIPKNLQDECEVNSKEQKKLPKKDTKYKNGYLQFPPVQKIIGNERSNIVIVEYE